MPLYAVGSDITRDVGVHRHPENRSLFLISVDTKAAPGPPADLSPVIGPSI